MNRQAGFSLLEMTIVLAIIAIGATTAVQIANTKMEERITSRTVSELSIAAEAAYECFVADTCSSGTPKNWDFEDDWKDDYLPNPFPDKYLFEEIEGTSKTTIRVDMGNVKRAKRVARAFGSSAVGLGDLVIVTLGIPGTESALSSLAKGIEVGGVLDEITIGSEKITEQTAIVLVAIANGLSCDHGYIRNEGGETVCAPVTCIHKGETLAVGEVRDLSSWGSCKYKILVSPDRLERYWGGGGRDGGTGKWECCRLISGTPYRSGSQTRFGSKCDNKGIVNRFKIDRSC